MLSGGGSMAVTSVVVSVVTSVVDRAAFMVDMMVGRFSGSGRSGSTDWH